MASLKRFAECENSVFISYAHADDVLYNGWISQFAAELKTDLEAALAREATGRDDMPKVYQSKYTGPVSGDLEQQLRDGVNKSFAMVIVVGEKYATSDWCLKELDYFHEAYGGDGLDNRLSILVLREEPMRQVTTKPRWQQCFDGRSPVWRNFVDPNDLNGGPVPVLRDDGLSMTNAMFKLYEPVRDDLVKKIRADFSNPPPPKKVWRWVLGACTDELKPSVERLADQLAEHEPQTGVVPNEALLSSKSLKALFDPAEALILPFNRGQPINDAVPGGHVAVQLAAWRALGRSDERVMLLDLSDIAPAEPAQPEHLQYLDGCKLDKLTADQVLDRLVPKPTGGDADDAANVRRPSRRVRVFIESNRNEPDAWKELGKQIRERWDRLLKTRPVNTLLSLRTDGFDIDAMDDFALDQADGVVLLWGQKDRKALLSQINKVEDIFVEPQPAIVARLSPPQEPSPQRLPAMQWEVLRFCSRNLPPVVLEPEIDDGDSLDAFVQGVLNSTMKRIPAQP